MQHRCTRGPHEQPSYLRRARRPRKHHRRGSGPRRRPLARHHPLRRVLSKLGPKKDLRVCYEAGLTGYVIHWQLAAMGIQCDVVAPSLVPTKAGDRIKTDRRDAERLARAHRNGDLATVWVSDAAHEALRLKEAKELNAARTKERKSSKS